ncbi:MAG: type VI secretion system baseplate subunit TssG [Spirochaetaceae bacterium]|jgi:type VI secretion system ImpH/TssG family protein|nr:type VI secretion system baseplate subunit TssG [Spirochaetaceae bacterium]
MENIKRLIKTLSYGLSRKTSAPDFWGLVRKLENHNRENPRLGYAKNPANENVRFGQVPYLYLPASDIAEIDEGRKAGVDATIFTYFIGLLGINGPMPLEFTSYVYQRSFNHFDHTWRRFLDIIHHRIHVLYYRAFAQNEQSISFDRPDDDPIQNIIKSLTGLPAGMDFGGKTNEKIMLSFSRNFSFTAKNREGLEDILRRLVLRRLLKTNVKVNDFVVAAYDLEPDDYAQLGNTNTALLGVNLQIGRKYLSATHQFEIEIGPVDSAEYRLLFAKAGLFLDILLRTIRLYLDRPLKYTLLIHLARGVVQPARLGGDEGALKPAQLGYFCWIGNVDRELELRIDASRFGKINN